MRIGQDPWVSGKDFVHFPVVLIDKLTDCGIVHLHQIFLQHAPPLSYESWTLAVDLDLSEEESLIWDHYILCLQNNLVCLFNRMDALLWTKNAKGGSYSPKLGY